MIIQSQKQQSNMKSKSGQSKRMKKDLSLATVKSFLIDFNSDGEFGNGISQSGGGDGDLISVQLVSDHWSSGISNGTLGHAHTCQRSCLVN